MGVADDLSNSSNPWGPWWPIVLSQECRMIKATAALKSHLMRSGHTPLSSPLNVQTFQKLCPFSDYLCPAPDASCSLFFVAAALSNFFEKYAGLLCTYFQQFGNF